MKRFLLTFCSLTLIPCTLWTQEKELPIKNNDVSIAITTQIETIVNQILRQNVHSTDTIDTTDTIEIFSEDENLETKGNIINGDLTITENSVYNSSVVVKNGTLRVAGTLRGNAVVLNGDLIVNSTGVIEGNAEVINGRIIKDTGASILGYEDISTTHTRSPKLFRKRLFHSSTAFDVPWRYDLTDIDQFIFRYNRVESVFLGLGSEKKYYWDGRRSWNAYGFIGWGFKSHKWRTLLGLSRQFRFSNEHTDRIFDIGFEGYSLTDTKDRWYISTVENTLAALLMHEDFRDYFQREGYTLYLGHSTQSETLKTELTFAFKADAYESMAKRVDWAFFGGKKRFRENPPIREGKLRSFVLSGGLSTVTKTNVGLHGWNVYASLEFSRRSIGSNVGFDQYIVDISRFQPLDSYNNLNVHLRVGTADGTLPPQRSFELGGIGTLNAFPTKAFAGNRMFLLNTEFILNGSIFDDLDLLPFEMFNYIILILMSDAGWVTSVPGWYSPVKGFSSLSFKTLHHNLGIAVGNRSGSYRIGFVWRTDQRKQVQLLLRLQRPF
ncbi:MAG: hypothetical protein N3A63_04315 [Bacteroidetes bacterium]|nr:hypothetical protein [Bacteroidota bacterium]